MHQSVPRDKGSQATPKRGRPGTRDPDPKAQAPYRIKAKEVMATQGKLLRITAGSGACYLDPMFG